MTLVITRQDAAGMADALDALFVESPFGIARLDGGGGIVGCNAALARLLDDQPSTLCGRAFADVFAADDRDEVRARLAKLATAAGMELVAPPVRLCTDNGAMIAWAGVERLRLGLTDDLAFAPRPRWPLDPAAEPVGYAGVKA